ncbi:putative glycosyl hydrolase family 61 [Colletotrichum sublineola]|uniref:lytic cellulose monooxygenase (C4-dehydrogenating) n=1 Tax=Colletotrichum sublineola TaxID=1173701 RepID=A0A066XQW6_COLSU|nr:putative glycosyl hydrolase family 61 [Colletotrichum sublineola]
MKSTVTSLLGSAALAAAHGIVNNGVIGGKNFTFYQPYQDPYMNPAPERISRAIQSNGPVEDVISLDIQCGAATAGGGTKPAKLVAKAAAGEEVTLDWTLWPESHIGPTITYMAKCANDDCTTWQPSAKDNVWFKVQEEGREGTSNNWGATPLMKAGNSGVKYTIPECIAPGQYLVRHEIIALHAASSYPGAQFYPSCHQIEVTGSGSTNPSDLVAFPGAYKGSDAGITYNAYQAQPYTVPGPKVFSCSGSGSGSGSAPISSAAPAPASPSQTAIADDDEEDCPATTTAAAPVATPTKPAGDEEDDCPAETPSATSTAAASGPTAKDVDVEEDDCPAETPATTTAAAPVATPTKPAGDDEDDCPAESTAPVATPTAAADEDEDCPAETTAPATAPTPTNPAGDDEDDCPAESTAPVATPTAAAGDEDDCPAETPSAAPKVKRMAFHERRLA